MLLQYVTSLVFRGCRYYGNKSFNSISQRTAEEMNKKLHSSMSNEESKPRSFEATPNHVMAGRGYREELYSARRIPVKKDLSVSLKRLQNQLNDGRILQRCKQRRYFVEPFEERNEITYRGRRRRFNELVRKTINDIREIHLSRHYDQVQ